MIILHEPEGVLVAVRQPDHAAVAAQLAENWQRPRALPQPLWQRFLYAVRHHDDGWLAYELTPALDQEQRPCGFGDLPTARHIAIWRRSIALAQRHDPYAGLLVAQHARCLFTRHADEIDPADQRQAQCFINELATHIDRTIDSLAHATAPDALAVEPAALGTAACLLALFDTWSLALLGAVPFGPLPAVCYGIDRTAFEVRPQEPPNRYRVSPWPFGPASLVLQVTAQRLPQATYADPSALAATLAAAPVHTLAWTLESPAPT